MADQPLTMLEQISDEVLDAIRAWVRDDGDPNWRQLTGEQLIIVVNRRYSGGLLAFLASEEWEGRPLRDLCHKVMENQIVRLVAEFGIASEKHGMTMVLTRVTDDPMALFERAVAEQTRDKAMAALIDALNKLGVV